MQVKEFERGVEVQPGVVYCMPATGEHDDFYFYTISVNSYGKRFFSADSLEELMAKVATGGEARVTWMHRAY